MNEKSWSSISSSHLFYMRFIGLIPFEGKTLDSLTRRLCAFFCHIMNISSSSMWIGYGIKEYTEIFEAGYVCEMLLVQGMFLRYLTLYSNRTGITKLMDKCRGLWSDLRDNESQVVRIFERKAYYLRTIVLVDSVLGAVLYMVTTFLIEMPAAAARNETKQLVYRFWLDVEEEPAYSLITIWQCLVGFYVSVEIASLETVGLFLIMMASGYLRVLQKKLLSLRDSSGVLYDEVLKCVQYHQEIMRFCEDIEYVMRNAFFVIVFTSTFGLTICGIKLLDQDMRVFKFVSLLLNSLFQFFIVQYGPEYLLNESEAIGDAAYVASLRQSTFEPKTNKMLFFMMIRAQRPIQLTAGGYINLSIETFGKMLRNCFSSFTLLRSFRE